MKIHETIRNEYVANGKLFEVKYIPKDNRICLLLEFSPI